MLIMLILQIACMCAFIMLSNVFNMLDGYAFRSFNGTSDTQIMNFNKNTSVLIDDAEKKTKRITQNSLSILSNEKLDSKEKYKTLMESATEQLLAFMREHYVNGAFLLIDEATLAERGIEKLYSTPAVYLRTSDFNTSEFDYENVFLISGPQFLLKKFKFSGALGLDDKNFNVNTQGNKDFYKKPLKAATEKPFLDLKTYGYWANPQRIISSNEEVVIYSLPLIDDDGKAFGVVGIDISKSTMASKYLFSAKLPYKNSFYAVSKIKDDVIDTDWVIAQTPYGNVQLKNNKDLKFIKTEKENIYKTDFIKKGKIYCSIRKLKMYSDESPYKDESWSIVGYVEEKILKEDSDKVRMTLGIGIPLLISVSLLFIFELSSFATAKIRSMEKEIEDLSPMEPVNLTPTGLKEIDSLADKVRIFSNEILQSQNLTSNLLEISLLPIGVYEIKKDFATVLITPYIANLIGIDKFNTRLSLKEWDKYYKKLIANPYMLKNDSVYEYHDKRYGSMYLRIREKDTVTDRVGVIVDISQEINEKIRMSAMLEFDTLTGLYNRRAFEGHVSDMISQNINKHGVMIFADLDNLKYVNDTYGHEFGDALIREAAGIFREFKKYGGVVARISGDEFAMFICGFEKSEEIEDILEKEIVNAPLKYMSLPDKTNLAVRFSTGVAYYPFDAVDVSELLKYSDFAMYQSKKNEKGSLSVFNKEQYFEQKYLLENRENIHNLVLYEQVRFAFQPIISMKTGKIFAYEALMRPTSSSFKSPLEILSVAKMQAKLKQLERMIFKLAFKTIYQNNEDIGDKKIFINSIPKFMISMEEIEILREQFPIDLNRIVIEVTETEADALSSAQENIEAMRRAGIQLAIDDYGTGYSSEVRMLNMRPEIIKMDINLISGINNDERKKRLAKSLISFCIPQNIKLLAEGIETSDELQELLKYDIEFGQGYYIAKPSFELVNEITDVEAQIVKNVKKQLQNMK